MLQEKTWIWGGIRLEVLLIPEGRKQKDPEEVSLPQENQNKQKRLERLGGFLGVKHAPAFPREEQRIQIGIK